MLTKNKLVKLFLRHPLYMTAKFYALKKACASMPCTPHNLTWSLIFFSIFFLVKYRYLKTYKTYPFSFKTACYLLHMEKHVFLIQTAITKI